MDGAAKPSRGQAALSDGFVNGHNPANLKRLGNLLLGGIRGAFISGLAHNLKLWLNDLQFAAAAVGLHLSVKSHYLPRLEFVAEIGGVEPDTLQPRAPLPGSHLKNRHATGAK